MYNCCFYRYVGLCATIKLIALAIFAVDWWLVRRKKQLEYTTPLAATAGVGSIISLDKCKFLVHSAAFTFKFTYNIFFITVFLEKGVIDNSQTNTYANDTLSDECGIECSPYDNNSKRILIAARHNRTDSRGIQLESR